MLASCSIDLSATETNPISKQVSLERNAEYRSIGCRLPRPKRQCNYPLAAISKQILFVALSSPPNLRSLLNGILVSTKSFIVKPR